ncbi:hypothetical protein ACT8ZV_20755 [Nocardioides sp. MAHUQ-72]|uniref:hypothetical protein n=1 Tax=unclassified Nocardioides TaxID=2615069 RepID=UPI00361F1255
MIIDLSSFTPWLVGFFVLAAVAGLLAVAAVADFVVSNRRVRLAQRQTVKAYYRGLALTH